MPFSQTHSGTYTGKYICVYSWKMNHVTSTYALVHTLIQMHIENCSTKMIEVKYVDNMDTE